VDERRESLAPGDDPELLAVAARLRADRWTAEVVATLHAAGVEPVLLKGPVVRRWLYADDPQARTYHDVDLLVAPHDQARAEAVLDRLGFVPRSPSLPGEWTSHADPWIRARDGAEIDLHRCLHGTESVPRALVWSAVHRRLETMVVEGVEVRVPDEVVRTLHVGLHVDAQDAAGSSPRADLERAVRMVDGETWQLAADMARELDIEAELATRLRESPAAATLVADLDLAAGADPRFEFRRAVRDSGAGPGAYTVERFSELHGVDRLQYAMRKALPPPSVLRNWSPLATRGPFGLVGAYIARVLWCLGRVPVALVEWLRVRRRLR